MRREKSGLPQEVRTDDPNLNGKILRDKIHLINEQSPLGIIAQVLLSVFLVCGLWQVIVHSHLIAWLVYMTGTALIWLGAWFFCKYYHSVLSNNGWRLVLGMSIFLCGLGWGYAGSMLIPSTNIAYQAFIIIILVGVTTGAIPFFSPVTSIYILYMVSAFTPLLIWLSLQGNVHHMLAYCGIIYLGVAAGNCYYSNNFLTASLKLRYKNINLDNLNHLLETRVNERTSDLEKSLAITKSTLESTADGILVVDLQNRLEYYNKQFVDMWHLPLNQIHNPGLAIFMDEIHKKIDNSHEFLLKMEHLHSNAEQTDSGEISFHANNRVFEWFSKPHEISERIAGRVWSFRDITLKKEMERQLSFQANHDALTGLANRTLLYDRISHAIKYAKRYRNKLVIFFLDIDNFNLINTTLGHEYGDVLLQILAARLRNSIRETDTVARFGGDEFVIVCNANSENDSTLLAQKLLDFVNKSMQLNYHDIVITASIGISVYPEHGNDATTLLKNADMAMSQAKNLGRNSFKHFDESIRLISEHQLDMQIQIRDAMANNRFYLLYQPIYDLRTKKIISVEALARWMHPVNGIILPQDFIPIAEESGIIVSLGEWIFREACRQNKLWQDKGLMPIRMAINVSGIQLVRDTFIDMVENIIQESALKPEFIEIELTESTIMDDKKQNMHTLNQLNKMGIQLTIDDFGTGYSSLSYLREFPVGKIKIAQPFMPNYMNESDAAMIKTIIAMGHGLKLQVLAEGIENEGQLQFLKMHECDEGQGFFLNLPVNAEEIEQLLRKNNSVIFTRQRFRK